MATNRNKYFVLTRKSKTEPGIETFYGLPVIYEVRRNLHKEFYCVAFDKKKARLIALALNAYEKNHG